jgi:hypothetical protein
MVLGPHQGKELFERSFNSSMASSTIEWLNLRRMFPIHASDMWRVGDRTFSTTPPSWISSGKDQPCRTDQAANSHSSDYTTSTSCIIYSSLIPWRQQSVVTVELACQVSPTFNMLWKNLTAAYSPSGQQDICSRK